MLVKAAHKLLALTLDDDDTLYTSTGTEPPAYVRLRDRSVLAVPFFSKSPERADRKSLENAPPLFVWLVRIRYCSSCCLAQMGMIGEGLRHASDTEPALTEDDEAETC